MQSEALMWTVALGVFIAVSAVFALFGFYVARQQRIGARLNGGPSLPGDTRLRRNTSSVRQTVARLDEKLFGFDDKAYHSKLRMSLVRAGFFSPDAPQMFVVAKALCTVAAPLLGYLFIQISPFILEGGLKMIFYGVVTLLGYIGSDVYLRRRQANFAFSYRCAFPDLLDLLVVCISAGLSLNAALSHVSTEFATQNKALSTNLAITLSEIRSGASIPDALDRLADRLNISEARSFAAIIKQSIELGTDIADAMRAYADDMRTTRILRAEEKANTLAVTLSIPLALFIFPVLLIILLTPIALKVMSVLTHIGGG